jgi:hypothetical protein
MTVFRFYVATAALLGSIAVASGCRAASDPTPGDAAGPEAGKLRSVLDRAAAADYAPPADGRLTESQVAMYLRVETRAAEIRRESEGAADRSDDAFRRAASADLTAAADLGYNPRELEWVRDRVQEARRAELSLSLLQAAQAGRASYLASLESERAESGDAARVALLEQRIRDLKKSSAESQAAVTANIRWNIDALAAYREEIDRVALLQTPAAPTPGGEPSSATAAERVLVPR